MAVENHTISNLDSFNEVKQDPRQVAGLYFHYMLDCVPVLASAVASDFFARPHLYTDIGGSSVRKLIAQLHAQQGSNELLPSKEQRAAMFQPVFGDATVSGNSAGADFCRLRDELVQAATAFAERVFDTGVEMLRERVRVTHTLFKAYITGCSGDSVSWSTDEALANLSENVTYAILRNARIASIFGISEAPLRGWPYLEDSNGDKLVEEISKQLGGRHDCCRVVTRERFTNLQRAAKAGAEAIAVAIDVDGGATDDDLKILITKVYTWGSALLGVQHGVAPSEQDGVPGSSNGSLQFAEWMSAEAKAT
jgi:hypothetical protein